MKPSELIADPKNWTRGWYARNSFGWPVEATDPSAVCWCLVGAVLYCVRGGMQRINVLDEALDKAEELYGVLDLFSLNDRVGDHDKVLRVLREIGQ